MSNITIREATEKDYEAVVGIIPNLYNGTDYMPACYHGMIKDPNRFMTLAELDGEIIGFGMYYVVDDGEVVMKQGGRTKADYRGRGISKQILQYGLSNVCQKYANLKWLSFSTKNDDEAYNSLRKPVRNYFYRIVRRIEAKEHDIIARLSSSPVFKSSCNRLWVDQTQVLTPTEAVHVLDELIDSNILSDYAWLVNAELFRPQHNNHVTIVCNNTKITPTVMVTRNHNGAVLALSFGTVTPNGKVVLFKIDFYCDITKEKDELENKLVQTHIAKHIILLSQWRGHFERVVLEVFLSNELSRVDVFECFAPADKVDFEVADRMIRAHCAETKLTVSHKM